MALVAPPTGFADLTAWLSAGRAAESTTDAKEITMPAAEEILTLTLRNIEVGPVLQQRRAAPTESEPAKTALRATRDYRVTFSADAPGITATFVVHIGWDAKGAADSCPVEQLEEVGQSLVREFAARIA
jgi:hypothetical protein